MSARGGEDVQFVVPRSQEGTVERWPVWYAPVGLVLGFMLALLGAGTIAVLALALGAAPENSPLVTLLGTLLQDLGLVVVAVVLAARLGQPVAADFGLTPAPARRAITLTIAAIVAFYAASALYAVLVSPDGGQDILDALGAERSSGYLIAAALLVVVIAPFAEEIFFRGFFYRALRNRLSTAGAAAITALLFAAIHYSGPDTLALLPLLALLGLLFCLLLEWTGSLYPAIALHVVNNALAFGTAVDTPGGVPVAFGAGALALLAAAIAPLVQSRRSEAG